MKPRMALSVKNLRINEVSSTGIWAITKNVPGKFFEKVVTVAYRSSEKSCIEYIDSLNHCR